jgi:preprotein translocase subunit SecF
MANTAVIDTIISLVKDYMTYMLPVIALLAGLSFIFSFLFVITMGLGRRTFKG